MKRTVAIVAGGDSSELPVSLRSAEGVYSFMDKEKYDLYIVEIQGLRWEVRLPEGGMAPIDRNDFSFRSDGRKIKFDFAYVTIHGTPGENGKLQGYFDLIRLPYSCSGVLPAAITFNKYVCNRYLKSYGIRIAPSLVMTKDRLFTNTQIMQEVGLPCFVKPNQGGSSFGVSKVNTKEQLKPAIRKAFKESNEVMIEAFMPGVEVTCGCYKTKKEIKIFPVSEVISKNEFFDYDAKYNGQVEEITPARLLDKVTTRVQMITMNIYDTLECSGIIRVDYIISAEGKINLLEVNTNPGMTYTSFIPQQIYAAGLDIRNVMTEIIEDNF